MSTTLAPSSTSLPPSRGSHVCGWIQKYCVLGEGDWFGQPFELRRWQKRFIWQLYELNPDGSKKYRRALLGLPKGNGKTPLAAAIGVYELCGGEHVAPVVPVGAANFEQADLTFGDMKTMCRESPALAAVTEVYDTEILLKGQPGRAYRVAAARGTNDGARPTCFIADELHEWNDPAKEGAHLVLANGTTKRADSLQLNITTAGSDLESLLGKMYQKGRRIEAGLEVDDSFLFAWYEGSADVDVEDPVALRTAIRSCNPAADDFLDVEEVASRFSVIPEFEARRYYLNQWTRAEESWLPPGAWERCKGDEQIPPGGEVYAGVDVALYHDSTALVLVHPRDDGRFVVRSHVWTPTEGKLDVADVMALIRYVADLYSLTEVVYDPRFFDYPAGVLADEGIPMVEVPQTAERMVPACGLAWELITTERVVHDGDPVLEDHVLSAAQRPSDRGWTLSKGRSKRHIDACIAMVMPLSVAAKAKDEEPDRILW